VQRLSVAAAAALMLLSDQRCSRDSGPTLAAPDAYAQAQSGTLTLSTFVAPTSAQTRRRQGCAAHQLLIRRACPIRCNRWRLNWGATRIAADRSHLPEAETATTQMQQVREAGFTQVYTSRKAWRAAAPGRAGLRAGLPVETLYALLKPVPREKTSGRANSRARCCPLA